MVDDTPMVVERANIPLSFELKREFSMIYVMEFGDQTLESHLAEWDRQLMNSSKANKEAKQFRAEVVDPQIGEEAEQLVVRLAQNLATFHKRKICTNYGLLARFGQNWTFCQMPFTCT